MKRPTPFDVALAAFDDAATIAETHRRELKTRFGFTDAQIGYAVLARRKKAGPYNGLAKAFLDATKRLSNGRAK